MAQGHGTPQSPDACPTRWHPRPQRNHQVVDHLQNFVMAFIFVRAPPQALSKTPTFAASFAHGTSRGMEPHADLLRCADGDVQVYVIGEHVQVIGRGGAA